MISKGFGGMIEFMWGDAASKMRELEQIYSAHAELYEYTYSKESPLESDWPNLLGSFNPAGSRFKIMHFLFFL